MSAPFTLGPLAQASGYRLKAFDSVGSTMDEAGTALATGDAGNIWFTALRQTAGRGRRGRQWETPHGNLAASLLIFPDASREDIATLGFVAGVAMGRALAIALPEAAMKTGIDGADDAVSKTRIALKWPNDVLADGAKLAGILLESRAAPDGRQAVIIGIGVNVVSAPEGLPYPATSVAALGGGASAESIFAALSDAWSESINIWDNGSGKAAILDEWRQHVAGIGAEVAISNNGEVVRGVFENIDAMGRLIVRTKDGRQVTIAAGDVHFGTTASMR